MRRAAIGIGVVLAAVATACVAEPPPPAPPPPAAADYFDVDVVAEGLQAPMAVRFSSAGAMFVAQREGVVTAFDSVTDTSPTEVVDLSEEVSTMWDRGLSGLAVDPGFHTGRRFLYVLYSYDAPPGGVAPAWPDGCATQGFGNDGVCGITTGRLERLQLDADNVAVARTVLVHDWCQQFGGHSVGDVHFGPDGSLYVGAGDGARFTEIDWGQFGGNPCGDPPLEGGMLRSQDARTTADPTSPHGAIIRIDPDTGAAWPTNPWAGDPDANRARIVAFGFRNPFRFTVDGGNGEVVVGDVGWNSYEEVNRFDLEPAQAPNFGWPCYEGPARQPGVNAQSLPLCTSLGDAEVTMPEFSYAYVRPLTPYCAAGGSSITGLAVSDNATYPAPFDSGLFLADYSRQCIVFFPRAGGRIDYDHPVLLARGGFPVDLQVGPNGNLYYADVVRGTINEVVSTGSNRAPVASVVADPRSGPLPLTVGLDGSGSTDADPGTELGFAWDLDDDGRFDDGTGATAVATFTTAGRHRVRLRVSDPLGASDVAEVFIDAGNSPPVPTIAQPPGGTYAPGQVLSYAGSATDPDEGPLPAAALSWSFAVHHCPDGETCHVHELGTTDGQASGTFEVPDHPDSFLRLTLRATDSLGATGVATRDVGIGAAP